jgi:hypothetical protein
VTHKNTRCGKKFKDVFGDHSQELLTVLQAKGEPTYKEEELFNNTGKTMGKKKVKRLPPVRPVAGHELWHDYWVEKFIASGDVESFKQCQDELAVKEFLDPIVRGLKGLKVSQKSLCCLYDRKVNEGSTYFKKYLDPFKSAKDEKEFWKEKISKSENFIKHRLETIINSDQMKWEIVYDV